jgi:hypothetical protein
MHAMLFAEDSFLFTYSLPNFSNFFLSILSPIFVPCQFRLTNTGLLLSYWIKRIKSVAYSSQGNHPDQLDFYN